MHPPHTPVRWCQCLTCIWNPVQSPVNSKNKSNLNKTTDGVSYHCTWKHFVWMSGPSIQGQYDASPPSNTDHQCPYHDATMQCYATQCHSPNTAPHSAMSDSTTSPSMLPPVQLTTNVTNANNYPTAPQRSKCRPVHLLSQFLLLILAWQPANHHAHTMCQKTDQTDVMTRFCLH